VRAGLAVLALLLVGCAARRPPQDLSSSPPGRTLQDGVYTKAQGQRGETVYFSTCVKCHRPEMTGSQIVPPLVGEVFLGRWNRRTAGDLFEWVRTSMPPGHDVALSPQDYADVLAYIFTRNDFPSGREEMPADFTTLRAIRIAAEPAVSDGGAEPAVRR